MLLHEYIHDTKHPQLVIQYIPYFLKKAALKYKPPLFIFVTMMIVNIHICNNDDS